MATITRGPFTIADFQKSDKITLHNGTPLIVTGIEEFGNYLYTTGGKVWPYQVTERERPALISQQQVVSSDPTITMYVDYKNEQWQAEVIAHDTRSVYTITGCADAVSAENAGRQLAQAIIRGEVQ